MSGFERALAASDIGSLVAPSVNCHCFNCGWEGPQQETQPCADFWSRVEPGEIIPAGDCPRCGAFVYLPERPHRLVITVEGGMIQHLMADRPDAIRIVIVDYDFEGVDEAEITYLPQQEEELCVEAALVSAPLVEPAAEARLALLFAAVEG